MPQESDAFKSSHCAAIRSLIVYSHISLFCDDLESLAPKMKSETKRAANNSHPPPLSSVSFLLHPSITLDTGKLYLLYLLRRPANSGHVVPHASLCGAARPPVLLRPSSPSLHALSVANVNGTPLPCCAAMRPPIRKNTLSSLFVFLRAGYTLASSSLGLVSQTSRVWSLLSRGGGGAN